VERVDGMRRMWGWEAKSMSMYELFNRIIFKCFLTIEIILLENTIVFKG